MKTIFSGIKPTGDLHLGNYFGALSQWVDLQHDHHSIFCVVVYHAITVPQDKKALHNNIIAIARSYLAAGIDPKKSIIFRQSDIKEHTELAWILNCTSARMSDLENMTQYKDAASKQINPSVGLFDYPILMAADILLYNTDTVPVGHDQLQHVELARDLAKRFNHDYGETFKIPSALIRSEGSRIMGLDDPTKKMSKSIGENNCISLNDSPEVATKKIMRAATDSDTVIKYDPANKPGISNLLTILSILENKKIKDLEKEFTDCGYGQFKQRIANSVSKFLTNFQEKAKHYSDEQVLTILADGQKQVEPLAATVLAKVRTQLGL